MPLPRMREQISERKSIRTACKGSVSPLFCYCPALSCPPFFRPFFTSVMPIMDIKEV